MNRKEQKIKNKMNGREENRLTQDKIKLKISGKNISHLS